ncbi:MAG: patatin-like phospholipase family protein [Gammaproteobacteria bacterium]|nr:patatin-like phospholipase family protein [Gammaproteobacteria bacterium]
MGVSTARVSGPRIGIALGSGAARGWAHIGVLQALEETGIRPAVVCGTSIGALVGGAYVLGNLGALERWVRELNWGRFLRLFDVHLVGGGFIEGERFVDAVRGDTADVDIDTLALPFAAIATDFHTGQEIWLQRGSLFDAIRASIALPGLFTPVARDAALLVDGGLVNPVPVSVCRALGAERVIAVNLNGDIVGRHGATRRVEPPACVDGATDETDLVGRLSQQIVSTLRSLPGAENMLKARPRDARPGLLDVVAGALNIMQDRITRSRMAGDPPDVLLAPRLAQIGLLEFARAAEAIEEGRRCVRAMRPALEDMLR